MTTNARFALPSLAALSLCASLATATNAAALGGACSKEYKDPIVLHRALPAGSFGAERKAVASVTVSRDGLVTRVALAQPSGDARFDAAAVRATQHTAFAPAARSCVAIERTFGYAIVSSARGVVTAAVMPHSIAVAAGRH